MPKIRALSRELQDARDEYEQLLSVDEPFPPGSSENDEAHELLARIERIFAELASLYPSDAEGAKLLQDAAIAQVGVTVHDLSPSAHQALTRVREFLDRIE